MVYFHTDKPPSPSRLCISKISQSAITLAWNQIDDGSSPVTEYVIETFDQELNMWTIMKTVPSDLTPFTLPKLYPERIIAIPNIANSKNYVLRVSAVNKHGKSDPTERTVPQDQKCELHKSIKYTSCYDCCMYLSYCQES